MEVEDDTPAVAADAVPTVVPFHDMTVAQLMFELSISDDRVSASEKVVLREKLMEQITDHHMAPVYAQACKKFGWTVDAELSARLSKANSESLAASDAAIANARINFGDVEIFEHQREKAAYLTKIGDKEGALKAYADINEPKLSSGQKIDIAMAKARIAMAHSEWAIARERIVQAKALNDTGGDWDRRNRLKVYEAIVSLAVRDFSTASTLLVDSLATFTATEVCSFPQFIFYTVLASLKSLDRVKLKKLVVDSPDVISNLPELPILGELLNSLYETRYRDFLAALSNIYPDLLKSLVLSAHAPYFLREMRLAAFVQFLESYKSVTLVGMATSFGVSVTFLDKELSRFIAAGRINAKIDAILGVIETTRADVQTGNYSSVIKQGDALLNKMQRLSRVISL